MPFVTDLVERRRILDQIELHRAQIATLPLTLANRHHPALVDFAKSNGISVDRARTIMLQTSTAVHTAQIEELQEKLARASVEPAND